MLFQFNSNTSNEIATAKLIRKDSVKEFKYEQLEGRKYRIDDPIQGYVTLKATQSIKTSEDLDFVIGDKIQIQGYKKALRVANMEHIVNTKQLMFLSNDYSVDYILDLEEM